MCTTSYVIVDGYSDVHNKKTEEQNNWRANMVQFANILFTDDMSITIRQDRILTSWWNKNRLIEGLTVQMEQGRIWVTMAKADADKKIARSAIWLSHHKDVAVGTDNYLLILLTQPFQPENRIYFFKSVSTKTLHIMNGIRCIQCHLPAECCHNLLFQHVVTGCDTTSAIYRQRKKKACKLLLKRHDLGNV